MNELIIKFALALRRLRRENSGDRVYTAGYEQALEDVQKEFKNVLRTQGITGGAEMFEISVKLGEIK